jgi:hypothetical protein
VALLVHEISIPLLLAAALYAVSVNPGVEIRPRPRA